MIMNELQKVFNNQEFGQVRIVEIDSKIYFVASDIAKSLGYKDPVSAISRHAKGAVKHLVLTNGGKQEMNVIPEGDIYRLAARSELPGAEKFESWIFDEILPTIRKHGMYVTDELLNDPDLIIRILDQLKMERSKKIFLQNENKLLDIENKLLMQENISWANRKFIDALVKKYGGSKNMGKVGFHQAWTDFKKELLYKHSINLKSRETNHINNTGRKPRTLSLLHEDEIPAAISTAVALCKQNNVNISEVIKDFEIGF